MRIEPRMGECAEGDGCAFVVDDTEPGSAATAFCNAPRRAGSAYCPHHHERCHLANGSADERRQLREIEALAKVVGGKQGRAARQPPAPLLRRLATLRTVDPNVPFRAVRASRGKAARAEPVAALYEQARMHHLGAFPALEDQMCAFTSDFDRHAAGYSPDRVDALVWAFTDLLVEPHAGDAIFEAYRRFAAQENAAP